MMYQPPAIVWLEPPEVVLTVLPEMVLPLMVAVPVVVVVVGVEMTYELMRLEALRTAKYFRPVASVTSAAL